MLPQLLSPCPSMNLLSHESGEKQDSTSLFCSTEGLQWRKLLPGTLSNNLTQSCIAEQAWERLGFGGRDIFLLTNPCGGERDFHCHSVSSTSCLSLAQLREPVEESQYLAVVFCSITRVCDRSTQLCCQDSMQRDSTSPWSCREKQRMLARLVPLKDSTICVCCLYMITSMGNGSGGFPVMEQPFLHHKTPLTSVPYIYDLAEGVETKTARGKQNNKKEGCRGSRGVPGKWWHELSRFLLFFQVWYWVESCSGEGRARVSSKRFSSGKVI